MPTALKFTDSMTPDDIAKGITSIGKRAKSIRKDIHSICSSILVGWCKSGAVNVAAQQASQLLENVDGAHQQKIVNWFGKHAGFEYVKDHECFGYDGDKTTVTVEEVQAAKAETCFELTPDAAPQPFDDIKQLKMLMARVASRQAKKQEGDVIDTDLWTKVAALVEERAA